MPAWMAPLARLASWAPALWTIDAASRVVAPWLALFIRLWLARAFLVVQVTGLMLGDAAAPLTGAWWADTIHRVASSTPGTLIQAACPLLLLIGLFTRPAALAMLLQVALLPPQGMTPDRGALWVALLAWMALSGPGALSLDRLLGRGAAASALPGHRALAAAIAWTDRHLAPAGLLLLRLVLAAALLRIGPTWFRPPGLDAMLPGLTLAALGILLIPGLAVRPAALVLAFSIPFIPMATDARLFWLLLVAVLAVHGGGLLSLDRLLRRTLAAPRPQAANLPHVVIVGGGFGGIAAAQALAHAPCQVTLVDRRNHQLFQPLLYQVATAGLSPAEIATPIRTLLRDQANARVLLAQVTGIDTVTRTVQLDHGALAYDHLILATGARHAYFGRDDWAQFAPGLKSIEDATAIRHRLLLAFERAEGAEHPAERAAWLTFAVIGGGPTGVELAGAIAELARNGLADEFRAIDPAAARVLLIQAAPVLLPGFHKTSSAAALASLRALGVEVLLDSKVTGLADGTVEIDGDPLPARTVLWAAGVMASPAALWLNAKADRAGRVVVGPDLSVPGHPSVFVVGDTAASDAWAGKPVPGLAPAAKQAGAYAARVLRARLAARPAPAPFRYRHMGSLATIGRESAVAEFGRIRVRGALAWWLWGGVHIAFLTTGRSRMAVMIDWLWAYLTFKRSTRLITGP